MAELNPGYPVASSWCSNLFTNPPVITVTFNRAVNPVTVTGTSLFLTGPGGGGVAIGPYSFSGDLKKVSFTPSAPLVDDISSYNVHVTAGVTTFAGTPAGPVTFPVTVENCTSGTCAAPTFSGTYPDTWALGPALSSARRLPVFGLTQRAGAFRAMVAGGQASPSTVDAYAWDGLLLTLTSDGAFASPMPLGANMNFSSGITRDNCDLVVPATPLGGADGPNLYVSAANVWTSGAVPNLPWGGVGDLPITAVTLNDGRIFCAFVDLVNSQPQIYDPVGNSWTNTAQPPAPFFTGASGYAVHTLPNGRVMYAGGTVGGVAVNDVAIYDPVGDAWSTATSMNTSRSLTRLVTFNSGRVCAVGGYDVTALDSCEVYDVGANTWTPIASMASPRYGHQVLKFPTGEVFVMGGYSTGFVQTATTEILSAGPAWAAGPTLNDARADFAALLIPDATQYTVIASGGVGPPFTALVFTEYLTNPTGGPVPGGGPPA